MQHVLVQQAATLDASLKQQAQAFSRMDEGKKSLNSPKLIGKLNSFSGKELDWLDWPKCSFLFETWVSSVYVEGQKALNCARDGGKHAITSEIVAGEELDFIQTDSKKLSEQWMGIVRNSVQGVGLDACRRLCRRYDPNNPQVNMKILKTVLHPTQVRLAQLHLHIETWAERYRVYKEKIGESLSDPMQRVCLQSMCQEKLASHLDMHVARLDTYLKMRTEIVPYLGENQSRDKSGAWSLTDGCRSQHYVPEGSKRGERSER